jgi:hypothetical protein
MEIRLLEEAGNALARLPVSVTRRPVGEPVITPHEKVYKNESSIKIGDLGKVVGCSP